MDSEFPVSRSSPARTGWGVFGCTSHNAFRFGDQFSKFFFKIFLNSWVHWGTDVLMSQNRVEILAHFEQLRCGSDEASVVIGLLKSVFPVSVAFRNIADNAALVVRHLVAFSERSRPDRIRSLISTAIVGKDDVPFSRCMSHLRTLVNTALSCPRRTTTEVAASQISSRWTE